MKIKKRRGGKRRLLKSRSTFFGREFGFPLGPAEFWRVVVEKTAFAG